LSPAADFRALRPRGATRSNFSIIRIRNRIIIVFCIQLT
jgi:hypothetical protein